MEVPPNLNATAQPIESNESKMSCRGKSPAASFTQRRNAVAPKAFGAVLSGNSGEHTRLACWFERLAVASRPFQRRLAETNSVKDRHYVPNTNNLGEGARSLGVDIESSSSSTTTAQNTCMFTTRKNGFLADSILSECMESRAGCRAGN